MIQNLPTIGVIGAGRWGRNHVRTLSELGVLAAIADPSADIRDEMAKSYPGVTLYDHHQRMLSDPYIDGVVIATPVVTHALIALEAMAANKHVFVEKPLAMTPSELLELSQASAEYQKTLMVGHLLLYQPAIQFIRHFLESGQLGKVLSIHQVRRNLGTVRENENAMMSLGVHDVAVLQYLIGDLPIKCRATGQRVICAEIEDAVSVQLEYTSGLQAHIDVSWMWPVKQREMTIIGEHGALQFDELTQSVVWHNNTVIGGKREGGSETVFSDTGDVLTLELQHYIDCIQTGDIPNSDFQQGVMVCEILNTIEGQLAHERVKVPDSSHSNY